MAGDAIQLKTRLLPFLQMFGVLILIVGPFVPPGVRPVVTRAAHHALPESALQPEQPDSGGVAARALPGAGQIELVGHLGGAVLAVAIQGSYAYVGEGPRLTVLNIANPSAPVPVGKGSVFADVIEDIAVSGSLAYVAADLGGVRILDVFDPAHPHEIGSYEALSNATGIDVQGDYAYVAAGSAGLQVLDVSLPQSPLFVGSCPSNGGARDVTVAGSYAYVSTGYAMQIVDISSPAAPVQVGIFDNIPNSGVAEVALTGSYAYAISPWTGLYVVDVSDPTNPTQIGHLSGDQLSQGVSVTGDYAYIAGDPGLQVIDVSNPAVPRDIGTYYADSTGQATVVDGSLVFLAGNQGGFQVVSVVNPTAPALFGFYHAPGYVTSVTVDGGRAYVGSSGIAGFWTVDLSNLAVPEAIGWCGTWTAQELTTGGQYAYVAGSSALRVIDISEPTNPVEIGSDNTSGIAQDVVTYGGYAYVADDWNGVPVEDISDPAHPVQVNLVDIFGTSSGITRQEQLVYVASYNYGGLFVLNIADPANPILIGSLRSIDPVEVSVAGDLAVIASLWSGLKTIDVSNPAQPVQLGAWTEAHYPVDVGVGGGYAYLSDTYSGLWVVDVRDPTTPVTSGFYPIPGSTGHLFAEGDLVFVAGGEAGLYVLRYIPEQPTYTVSGHVLDEEGNPLPGVTVSAGLSGSGVSDASGAYTITQLVSGTYELVPERDGWMFSPRQRMVTVPPDAAGQDFSGSDFPSDVVDFVTDSRVKVIDVIGDAEDVSEAGDYFLDKLGLDVAKTVVDTAMNIWELSNVDWKLVGKGLQDIATPGYEVGVDAAWQGWTDSRVARHWYKPLYDEIHNDPEALFHQVARSGLLYYAGDAGIELSKDKIKEWLASNIAPGFGNPIAEEYGARAASLGDGYELDLLREQYRLLDSLPLMELTPELQDAYRADMLARQELHAQLVERLTAHRDLLYDSYQDSLASEQDWLRFWGPLLAKWSVVGGATLAWDGPGYYVASTGFTVYTTLYDFLAGVRAITHDAKMVDQSLRFLDGRALFTYSDVSQNTVEELNLIRAGMPPQIPTGQVGLVQMKSFGHYRLWPGLWWAEASSHVETPITNNSSYGVTYSTAAAYTHTGFWTGAERLLPEGQSLGLSAGASGTAVVKLKYEDVGASPDDLEPVNLLVWGATETGFYPISNMAVPWQPTRVEVMTGSIARAPVGYTQREASLAPAYAYPLASVVTTLPDSMDHQVTIGVANPFSMTVNAVITQPIPSEMVVKDAGGGQLLDGAVVWTEVLSAEAGIETRVVLGWEGPPGESTWLPGVEMSFTDPSSGDGDVYTSTGEIVFAAWPLAVSADVPLVWKRWANITIPCTLTNIADTVPVEGVISATVRTPEGEILWQFSQAIDLAPGQAEPLSLLVEIPPDHDYVVMESSVSLGSERRNVVFEIISIKGSRVYLPIVSRNLGRPGSFGAYDGPD